VFALLAGEFMRAQSRRQARGLAGEFARDVTPAGCSHVRRVSPVRLVGSGLAAPLTLIALAAAPHAAEPVSQRW